MLHKEFQEPLAGEFRRIEAAPLEPDPALAEAGEVEQIGHQALHPIRVPLDRDEQLTPLLVGRLARRVQEEPARGSHDGQRRPELVGEGREQVRSEPLQRIKAATDRAGRERRRGHLFAQGRSDEARPVGPGSGDPSEPQVGEVPEERGGDVRGGLEPRVAQSGSQLAGGRSFAEQGKRRGGKRDPRLGRCVGRVGRLKGHDHAGYGGSATSTILTARAPAGAITSTTSPRDRPMSAAATGASAPR